MDFENKDKDSLVQIIIDAISEKVDFEIDFSDGEPLRTIIEAFAQEMDLQYWQLEQVYDSSFIETSINEDLTKLVKILGIEREAPKKATGVATFYRNTAADNDYLIPYGTLIETLPDIEGNTIQFETVEDVMLMTGAIEKDVKIQAVNGGYSGNVAANKLIIINDPPMGIEFVTNTQGTIGGKDEETDDELTLRATTTLETSGNATVLAIEGKIKALAGVKQVTVFDMGRGIGTVDVLVLGDVIPLPQDKKDEVNNIIATTKSGGIDVQLQEPRLITANVVGTLTLQTGTVIGDVIDEVNTAIDSYVNKLTIGQSLIKNQLERFILNSSEMILDINLTSPSNITVQPRDIIRTGTITIS